MTKRCFLLLLLSLASSASAKDEFITSKTPHTQEAKFAKAVDEQLGVLGNDFFSDIFVGTAPNEGRFNKNIYFPVDGFKRTFVGRQINVFSVAVKNAGDDDVNLVLETRPDHPLILANATRLRGEEATHALNVVNGEIDLHQTHMHVLRKYAASTPKANVDAVGMYGPWVIDRGWLDEDHWYTLDFITGLHGHPNFIEIHPMEQLWWVEKQSGNRIFHLSFMNDNSGRFDKRSRFDTDDGTLNRIWVENPMVGRFAVAFETRSNDPVEYVIERIGDKHAQAPADGRVHKLVLDGKTLVTVREPAGGPDLITVGFRNAGVVPEQGGIFTGAALTGAVTPKIPVLVRGFIVIQTRIGVSSDSAGNLFLKMTEKRARLAPHTPPLAIGKGRTRVTLESFSCASADDNGGVEEIHGYVGVRVTSPVAWPKTANILPADSTSPLLWSLLDDLGSLHLKQLQTVRINKSFNYDLDDKAEITLVADLNEDDDSGDDNPTTADEDDDRLAGINSPDCRAGLCSRTIKVRDLPTGRPLPVAFTFGSGGTRVTVLLKVENLGGSVISPGK